MLPPSGKSACGKPRTRGGPRSLTPKFPSSLCSDSVMKSLLLTGATGFVGRNLLLRAGAGGIPVLAPVRNAAKLSRCLAEDGLPDGLVRALAPEPAEWPDVAPSHAVLCAGVLFARSREEYFSVNLDWTQRVIRALPPDCRIILLSSQSAGGPTPEGVFSRSEADADRPITWYGESKLALERAVRQEFPGRPITILRPPMILGARDTATLPLFQMARGRIRTKPGLRTKFFSYLAVEDVVEAIFAAASHDLAGPYYLASNEPVSDIELIAAAARAAGGRGITLRIPLPLVRVMAAAVDAIPAWREAMPSLTRDRAREIWPDRWVVDSAKFQSASGWSPRVPVGEALAAAHAHFRAIGRL